MSPLARTPKEGALAECLEEMDRFITTLDRYPPTTVAVALSVHLQSMLSALVECELCTAEQAAAFVQELERDVCAKVHTGQQGHA